MALLARRQGRYRPFFILTTLIFLLVPLSGIVETRGTPLHAGLGILAIVLIVTALAPPLAGNWQVGRTGPVPVLTALAIAGIAAFLMAQTGHGSWISLFYFAAIVGQPGPAGAAGDGAAGDHRGAVRRLDGRGRDRRRAAPRSRACQSR